MIEAPKGKTGGLPRTMQEPVNHRLEKGGQGRTLKGAVAPR